MAAGSGTRKAAAAKKAAAQTTPVVQEESKFPAYGKDQEIKDTQQAKLAEAREEHNRRTGGGAHAK